MSKKVFKNWFFLQLLLESPSLIQKKTLIKTATSEQVKALSEVIANTLTGALPLPPDGRNKLHRFREVFREIAGKTTTLKRRKALLFKHMKPVLKLMTYVQPVLKLMKK